MYDRVSDDVALLTAQCRSRQMVCRRWRWFCGCTLSVGRY